MPLRPIASSIGSPYYALSKYLLNIIKPLLGRTESFVRNSQHFVDIIKDIKIDYQMIGFDVTGLYTNVPVDEALEVIRSKLEADSTIADRTNLPIDGIIELLSICLKSTYFQYNQDFYQQNDGMAMGSPLSPVVSNIYMEYFEQLAIDQAPRKPKLCLRYVDDPFVIWQHGTDELTKFLNHLNSLRPTIQFTIEKQSRNYAS